MLLSVCFLEKNKKRVHLMFDSFKMQIKTASCDNDIYIVQFVKFSTAAAVQYYPVARWPLCEGDILL